MRDSADYARHSRGAVAERQGWNRSSVVTGGLTVVVSVFGFAVDR